MKILILLNEGPLSNERAYNALRTGVQFQKDGHSLCVYLISDGVYCALAGQEIKDGANNIRSLAEEILSNGGEIKMCTSCGKTRGITEAPLIKGAGWTNLKTLTDWVISSDKTLNF